MHEYLHLGRANELTNRTDRLLYRALEILPGLLAWLTLAFVFFISLKAPIFAAAFIITFDVYWLIKTVYLSLYMRSSFQHMQKNLRQNWREKLE
ncbi:MAG TPA: hypothetical protein VEK36_01635, partial [Candidatus Paceibacterota bacterium]|nr:hypothetical protein [Candidatus Paceibacterota bacterium]